jgi:hypothetical protein
MFGGFRALCGFCDIAMDFRMLSADPASFPLGQLRDDLAQHGQGSDRQGMMYNGYVQMQDILPLPSAPSPYDQFATPSQGIAPQAIMGFQG